MGTKYLEVENIEGYSRKLLNELAGTLSIAQQYLAGTRTGLPDPFHLCVPELPIEREWEVKELPLRGGTLYLDA